MNQTMKSNMTSINKQNSAIQDLAALLQALTERKAASDTVSVRATEKMTAVWGG